MGFEDVTEAAGIVATHDWATSYVDTYEGTGQAWGDANGDGYLDLYVTDQSGPNSLYLGGAAGLFSLAPNNAQVAVSDRLSCGALFFDYDNDGWQDLYVLNLGPNALFHNQGGEGFIERGVAAGIADTGKGVTASAADYDGDGDLDLYVCNWACLVCGGADPVENARDRLYRNEGNGTFVDVSEALGGSTYTNGFGFAAAFFDYDNDGDPDIYLVNDKGYAGPDQRPINRNVLWRNDGPDSEGNWQFGERAIEAGVDARVYGMGVAIGDVDGDLDLDIACSDDGPTRLFLNQGSGQFLDASSQAGVDKPFSGWGTILADFNRDGDLDLFVAAEHVPCAMFLNEGDATFRDVSTINGIGVVGDTLGCACADYNRDGWLDLALGNYGEGYRLYKGIGLVNPIHGPFHWITVKCVGGGPVNRDAIGTRVTVTRSDGVVRMQEVKCGSSLGAGNDTALLFGLRKAGVDQVDVRWPDGQTTVHTDVKIDGIWTVTHPDAE